MHKGFSLLEILIVCVLIAILTAVALPIYSHYVTYEKRLVAKTALTKLATSLETYYLAENSYENATLAALHVPEFTTNNAYQLQIKSATATQFLIAAQPVGQQAIDDYHCGTLMINEIGEWTNSGTASIDECT